MLTQSYEWGRIDWVQLNEQAGSAIPVNIGFLTLEAGKQQRKHIHYGEKQILYIVSGTGTQIVEQEEIPCGTGDVLYIESGSAHETINRSDEPLVELVISFPSTQLGADVVQQQLESFTDEIDAAGDLTLDRTVCEKFGEMTRTFKFPLTIFNAEEEICSRGVNYPAVCEEVCHISEDVSNCPVYDKDDRYGMPIQDKPTAVLCPYGVTVFVGQIRFQNRVIGWLRGGHIRTMESLSVTHPLPEAEAYLQNMEYVHRGRVEAILQQVQMIQRGILNECMARTLVDKLDASKESIQHLFARKTDLESAMRDSMEKLLSIQLNNHFLFNTLNSIASMALKEDAMQTYQSIIDLSSMFRYNLRSTDPTVRVQDELGYLDKYMKLQRLRFGDRVSLEINVDDLAGGCQVPFNCLQPIVENSFKHGYRDRSNPLIVKVNLCVHEEKLVIEVIDNGLGFNGKLGLTDYLRLYGDEQPRNNGLHMIISKMMVLYGEAFDFGIEPGPCEGTRVCLKLPAVFA